MSDSIQDLAPISFPRMVEFQDFITEINLTPTTDEANSWVWNLQYSSVEMGYNAFNGAPEIATFFNFIKKHYKIDTIVETGTFKGSTTRFFSKNFKDVYTIELNKNFYDMTVQLFKDVPNIHNYYGESTSFLEQLLPHLKDRRLLFYLDAHWYEYWPLLDEIKIISKSHKDQCILVVDDCQVPGRSDIDYDEYKGIPCSYEYVKEALDDCFTKYDYHYLIPRDPNRRAKLVAIPKNWRIQ